MKSKRLDRTVLGLAAVGSLVLLNVIGIKVFGRLDLTGDKQFTLSKATRDMLAALKEPVTVRAYFSADLPPPVSTNARYVKDLLDEYYAAGHGNFRYEFIDPLAAETEEDKEKAKQVTNTIVGPIRAPTSVERELQGLGIPAVQVQANERDKMELKRAYMGLSIEYGSKKEAIPVVKQTTGLEYDLTTLIRKMTREKTPKLALVVGHEGLDPEKEIGRAWSLMGQVDVTTTIDLTQKAEIPDDVDAIVVAGPKTPFADAEKKAIDAFVMKGKGAAFLLDTIRPDLSTLQSTDMSHGLGDLLAAYGVNVNPGLVVDEKCAPINITQQRGLFRVSQPVEYPFMPLPKSLDPSHPLTRSLANVVFPFMSPLALGPAVEGVKAESLVRSSPRSWVQEPPYNLDPLQRWTTDSFKDEGAKDLVVAVSGTLKSYADPNQKATNARVLVSGGASFMSDQFLSPGNQALVLNLVDWLVLDEALLSMRTRGLAAAPLADVSDLARGTVKYMNVIGLPFLFVLFGLIRWALRDARRREVKLS